MENSSETISNEIRISHEPWYRKNVYKWISYDLGNTIYSMVVVSLVFLPLLQILYFERDGDGDSAINNANFAFSTVLLIGNLILASISPFLGAYADQLKRRNGLLIRISMLCITFMAALVISAFTKSIIIILLIFFFANMFYQLGLIVYDSMLPFITDRDKVATVSGTGVAIGYFGSFIGIGLGFALAPIFGDFVIKPSEGVFELGYIPYMFPVGALLFLLFALPIVTLKEKDREMLPKKNDELFEEVKNNAIDTAKEIFNYRSMFVFLIGWLIYVDAANTVIAYMTPIVQIGLEFGDSGPVLIVLGIGIIGAVAFTYPVGKYIDKNGPKKGLTLITIFWITALIIAFFTNLELANGTNTPEWLVYVFPVLVGPALGGGWVVQRQYVTELSPPSKVGNYFGFANIFGRISAAIGPFIWATTILGLNQGAGFSIEMATRMGLVFIGSIMLIGYFIIMRVDDVHEIYLKGGRAKGDGTWVDDNNVVIYESKM